jgi:hypothetical protein
LCRRDHGLTWLEFIELTLAQLEALEERRTIAVRHERFNAALITSTLINAHRSEESDAISPFDFLAGFETDPEEVEKQKARAAIKHAIALAFTQMRGLGPEAAQKEKLAMVERMKANGVEDAEELIREVFPDL